MTSDRPNPTPERDEFRSAVRWTFRGLMDIAAQRDWINEANILLDALALLERGPDADIDAPVTAEERNDVIDMARKTKPG